MVSSEYEQLARRLDSLPNGYPATEEGIELELLAHLFNPEEAAVASLLRLTKESPEKIADRIGADPGILRTQLKSMARRGLIAAGRCDDGLGFGLMPFVVGIYEMQVANLDSEIAQLFEEYYQKAFGRLLAIEPQVHRVIPIGESISVNMEIRPYENATSIVEKAEAWGVLECICRKQKSLLGDPCQHPLEVCMAMSPVPGAFDGGTHIKSLTKEEALDTLQFAAESGLVHSVSNNQEGLYYICNCCTCSCAILRGLAELGIANAVARSPFVNQVDESRCLACGDCLDFCQFDALTMDELCHVNNIKCVGCGVCVQSCPEEALFLVRRPLDEVKPIPETMTEWMATRAVARNMDLAQIL